MLALLGWLRFRVLDPRDYEQVHVDIAAPDGASDEPQPTDSKPRLPTQF